MAYLATNEFASDGVTDTFTVTFAGGYIDPSHVKAYITHNSTFERTDIEITQVTEDEFALTGSVPSTNYTITFYRDTPRDAALVDFTLGSRITERNLDKVARQGVYIGAEIGDKVEEATDGLATIRAACAAYANSAYLAQIGAENARDEALILLNNFRDRWYGARTTDPVTTDIGGVIPNGALYFNTTTGARVRVGGIWVPLVYTAGAFASSATVGCGVAPDDGRVRIDMTILSQDPTGTYGVYDHNGDLVDFGGFLDNPVSHTQGGTTYAGSTVSYEWPVWGDLIKTAVGKTWTFRHDESGITVSEIVIPDCVGIFAYALVSCGTPEGTIYIQYGVNSDSLAGSYGIYDHNDVLVDFGVEWDVNPMVFDGGGGFLSYATNSSTWTDWAGNEADLYGKTWTLKHIESGTIVQLINIPDCGA